MLALKSGMSERNKLRMGHHMRSVCHVSVVMWVFISAEANAQATGKLNDTGIVTCANDISNSIACGYADGDTNGFPRQDGQMGRSPKDNLVTPGTLSKPTNASSASPGFSFQKIAYTAVETVLATSATQGTTASNWACTKDNVTGLIWDMKVTTASNARLNANTYTWYNTNTLSNGGNSGTQGVLLASAAGQCYQSTHCDTAALITYINGLNICGESTGNDWRLPTRLELMSIVDVSKQGSGNATVDSTFFPNIVADRYWTSENVAGNPDTARVVNFGSGQDSTAAKSSKIYVILVRP